MKKTNTLKAVYSALFAALIFVATQFIKIPLAFGYFNLGDCFILICATVLGGYHAIFAAAIGSALADILSGYVIYAPGTFIIKMLMVLVMICISRCGYKKASIFGAIASELVMVLGYFLYDTIIYSFAVAVACLWGNILQGIVAIITSVIIITVFEKSGLLKRLKI